MRIDFGAKFHNSIPNCSAVAQASIFGAPVIAFFSRKKALKSVFCIVQYRAHHHLHQQKIKHKLFHNTTVCTHPHLPWFAYKNNNTRDKLQQKKKLYQKCRISVQFSLQLSCHHQLQKRLPRGPPWHGSNPIVKMV